MSQMQSVFESLPPCHTSMSSLRGKAMEPDTVSLVIPMCRICHMPEEDGKQLSSPCRCCGSLKYVHNSCLTKWIEISSRRKKNKPPTCELCRYQYQRRKRFKLQQLKLPRITKCDKILHTIFFISVFVMLGCAIATVLCFLSDRGRTGQQKNPRPGVTVQLTTEEIVTLTCGVMFFVAFFVAMSVQIKARRTIYQIVARCVQNNMVWQIDMYDKKQDLEYKGAPAKV